MMMTTVLARFLDAATSQFTWFILFNSFGGLDLIRDSRAAPPIEIQSAKRKIKQSGCWTPGPVRHLALR